MRKKRRTSPTLLTLHDLAFARDEYVTDDADQQVTGRSNQKADDPFVAVNELQDKIQRDYRLIKERESNAPPLLHICIQYCAGVVQTRYEQSVFSSLVHEADNLMDKVTGDEDDSDFETLIEVDDDSSVFSGLGIGGSNPMPELRILIIKITNSHKINKHSIVDGKAIVTYQSGKKRKQEKTRRRVPDYRHVLSFNHVFIFRGVTIKQLRDADIKLGIKTYSEHSSEEAFIILSDGRCVMEDRIAPSMKEFCVISPSFWKDYLDVGAEGLYKFAVPMLCENRPDVIRKRNPVPPSPSPTPPPAKEEQQSTADDSSSSSNSSDDEEIQAISESTEIVDASTSISPLDSVPTDEERPLTTPPGGQKQTPSPTTENRELTPSPVKENAKSTSRRSSADSTASRSRHRKKGRFSLDKITKIFS